MKSHESSMSRFAFKTVPSLYCHFYTQMPPMGNGIWNMGSQIDLQIQIQFFAEEQGEKKEKAKILLFTLQ